VEAVLPCLVADPGAAEQVEVVVPVQVGLDRRRAVGGEFGEERVVDARVSPLWVGGGPGTGIAVLTLLSGLSEQSPLLVVADDVQWLDPASLDALAFAAWRLESERLVLLLAARGIEPPRGLERDFPEPLLLAPLSTPETGRLLDAQPRPPRGRAREQVLAQAAGNPLALIELSKVIAADPAAGRRWAAEPLPLTGRLTAVTAARCAALPGTARAALLLAAVADSPDLAAAIPGLTAAVLAPAEAAGLIGWACKARSSPIRLSGRPSTMPRRLPSVPRRTWWSRTRCVTGLTATPGT
jgi:hypothetical protein